MIIRLLVAVLLAASTATPKPPWQGLPVRTATGSGAAGDPVNVAFEGTRAGILAAFSRAGWLEADPLSLKNDLRLAQAAIDGRPYPKAPVSNLYLFGRSEDFAVEHELGTVARRDHARFWYTGRTDPATHLDLWVGDASRDDGIKVLRKHGLPVGTTHHIDPDLDTERSRIVGLIQATGMVSTVVMEPGMGATRNAKNGGGDPFSTDGKVSLIVLKN